MTKQPSPTAVCIIRMEPQGGGLLVSVRLNPDVREVSGERQFHFANAEDALCVVRTFVEEFSRGLRSANDEL